MLLDDFIKENIVIPVILNENTYSCVSNKRAVANKHPGLNFALKKISVLYLINVLA